MNLVNRFTGWLDVPLNETGIQEAQKAADHCQQFDYSAAFTSNLERAHETLLIILSHQHKIGIFHHPDSERYSKIKHPFPPVLQSPAGRQVQRRRATRSMKKVSSQDDIFYFVNRRH